MERASSDVGFMFIAYNLRRIGNILTKDQLKEYLRILVSLFSTDFDLLRSILKQYKRFIFTEQAFEIKYQASLILV